MRRAAVVLDRCDGRPERLARLGLQRFEAAVRRELAFEFREIDIGWSGELYEEHKHDIPVVEIDGKRAFKHRVDPAALKERLR